MILGINGKRLLEQVSPEEARSAYVLLGHKLLETRRQSGTVLLDSRVLIFPALNLLSRVLLETKILVFPLLGLPSYLLNQFGLMRVLCARVYM